MRLAWLMLATAPLALSACASDSPHDPEPTAQRFIDALEDGDGEEACQLVASPDGEPVTKGSAAAEACAKRIDPLLDDAYKSYIDDWQASPVEVEENGDKAVVRYTENYSSIGLVRAADRWYVVDSSFTNGEPILPESAS